MSPNNIATKLCSTCSKHTLQALYWGTNSYPLSKDCDLCNLIWDSLTSDQKSELSKSHETLIVSICAARKNGLVAKMSLASGTSGVRTWSGRVEAAVRSHSLLNAPPISLLNVYTPMEKFAIASLRMKPLDSKYPMFSRLAYAPQADRFPGSRSILSPHVSSRDVRPPTSDENIEMMQSWISSCVANHSACRKSISGRKLKDNKEPQSLPTRLIEVTPKVRLRETAGQRGQYLALSYCWGTGTGSSQIPNTVTTRANLDAFFDDIPIDTLAPTVRDAILLAQKLGFRYLWVDALCIIQGDTADWEREARQMSQVYENALCTIVALGADHAGQGLFLSGHDSTPPEQGKQAVIPCRTNTRRVLGYASITAWPRPGPADNHHWWLYDFADARWSRRGWVLQERMLSRRMLYFGRKQTYWTCMERMICEDGIDRAYQDLPVCNPHNLRVDLSLLGVSTTLSHIPILRQLYRHRYDKPTIVQYIWEVLVRDYSKCNLTVGSDKLMAIAGLASALRQRSGMTYFEGLWVETACFGLAWRSTSLSRFPERNAGPSAHVFGPSWSWGFTKEDILFPHEDFKHIVPFFGCKARAKGTVKTLPSGRKVLELNAPVVRIASTRVTEPAHVVESDIKLQGGSHQLLTDPKLKPRNCGDCEDGQSHHILALDAGGQISGLLDFDRPEYKTRDFEAALLYEEDEGEPDRLMMAYRVLLIEEVPEDPGFFRRLGMSTLYAYHFTAKCSVDVGKSRAFQLV